MNGESDGLRGLIDRLPVGRLRGQYKAKLVLEAEGWAAGLARLVLCEAELVAWKARVDLGIETQEEGALRELGELQAEIAYLRQIPRESI